MMARLIPKCGIDGDEQQMQIQPIEEPFFDARITGLGGITRGSPIGEYEKGISPFSPWVLDVNPNPELSPEVGICRAVKEARWTWERFVAAQIEWAR